MDAVAASRQRSTRFVGRDRELAELLGALDEASAGSGRLILIGGEPGVGKSRLADELASHAREREFEALWGRGWEDAGAPPYWPWVQALRSHIRNAEPADLRRQLGEGASDVAQMLPDLRSILPDVPPPSGSESESARFQLFDSATTFLRNAAETRPLLIVLDDLQAADTPSLLLLRFLASQVSEMRALVLGTYRDIALTPDHPLTSALAEFAREPNTRLVPLTGLQAPAVAEFIGAAAGVTPPAHLVSAVWRETKGNPLFVGEAVRLLSAEGPIADAADLSSLRVAVPAGVRDVISRRIGHLPDASIRALESGAALGPEFSLDVLRRVGEFEGDALLDLLDAAVGAGLLVSLTGGMVRYRFSHDLIRETLYDGLAPSRRVRLHGRIAEVLEQLSAGAADANLAELAFHFFQAVQGIDAERVEGAGQPGDKAIDYARRAAEQAARSYAYEEASRLYRMALAVLDLAASPDEQMRTEILLALGDAENRAGELEVARTTFREAARIARQRADARHLARAALGYHGRLPWLRAGPDTDLIPLLQDALVMLGGADDYLRVRLLTRLACAWRSTPERRDQSAMLSQQAVDLARKSDDPATLSFALAGRFWATWWPENPDGRLAIAEEMLEVAESAGDAERLVDAHLMLYLAYTEIPRMADARRAEEAVRRVATELRQPTQLWLGVAPRALVALMVGDYQLVEEMLASELQWTEPITWVRDEVSAGRMHLYLLRREQGRAGEAEASTRAAAEEFPWYPMHRAALANLLLDLDRVAEARAVFDELARDDFRALYRDNEWLLGMSLAAEACARLRDAASATVLYEQLTPFAGRHAVGQAEGSLGAVDRYLGLLAATTGDLESAEEHLVDAIRLNEEMGARPWAAHAAHDLGLLLLERGRPGDRGRVATLFQSALQTARAVGMTALEAGIAAAGHGHGLAFAIPSAEAGGGEAVFRREGEAWAIGPRPGLPAARCKGPGLPGAPAGQPGARVPRPGVGCRQRGAVLGSRDQPGRGERARPPNRDFGHRRDPGRRSQGRLSGTPGRAAP